MFAWFSARIESIEKYSFSMMQQIKSRWTRLTTFPRFLATCTMFAQAISARLLSVRSVRPTFQTKYLPRYQRSFSFSPTNRASPVPENLTDFTAELQKTSIWKKLANHPGAISAIQEFGQVLQKAGKCIPL
jgi:hypothetical protein